MGRRQETSSIAKDKRHFPNPKPKPEHEPKTKPNPQPKPKPKPKPNLQPNHER